MIRKIFVLIAALTLTGCDIAIDNFELVDKGNNTYLLNKTIGNVYLIDDANLIKLTEINPKSDQLGKILRTKNLTIADGRLDLNITVKLLSDKVLYIMRVRPSTKDETQEDGTSKKVDIDFSWFNEIVDNNKSLANITLQLKDSDGFKYLEKQLSLNSNAINSVDADGKVYEVIYEGEIPASPDLTQNLAWIDVSWIF